MFQKLRDVLRHKEFVKLWIGLTQSRLGTIINLVALSLFVYDKTKSGLAVGKLEIAMILPSVLIGLFAGSVVDRFNKKWIMVVSDILRAALFLGMAIFTDITSIYIIVFSSSVVSLFFSPAYDTSIPLIMSKQQLIEANSLNELSAQMTRIVAPGLAGIMFLKLGFSFICIFNSATYMICAIIVSCVDLPYNPNEKMKWGDFKAPLRNIIEGIKYVKNNRLPSSIVAIFAALQLGTGAINVLLVMFVKNVLHGSDAVYGLIISAVAAGSVIGVFVPWFRGKLSEERLVRYCFVILGLLVLGLSINSNIPVALLLLVLIGILQTVVNISVYSALQRNVPNEILGRTFTSMNVLAQISMLISMGVGSMLADVVGVRMIYIMGSIIVLITGIGAFKFLSFESGSSQN